MKKLRIYCSGNMSPTPEYYWEWTSKFAKEVEEKYTTKSANKNGIVTNRAIVAHDLNQVRNCDIVVLNLTMGSPNSAFTGSVVEIYEAHKQGKMVYAFNDIKGMRTPQADNPWMSEFITHEFETYDDLIEYLMFDEDIFGD